MPYKDILREPAQARSGPVLRQGYTLGDTSADTPEDSSGAF